MDPRQQQQQQQAMMSYNHLPIGGNTTKSNTAPLQGTSQVTSSIFYTSQQQNQQQQQGQQQTGDVTAAAAPSSILLGGEDAMEEDEGIISVHPPQSTGSITSNTMDSLIPVKTEATTTTPPVVCRQLHSKMLASPYPHHQATSSASRFRNALARITLHPHSDQEAWQALLTEVYSCFKTLLQQNALHICNAETHAKLDWMESCYGNFFRYFPYASSHYQTIMEMLLAQSARMGEPNGPYIPTPATAGRPQLCELKLEYLLEFTLGVTEFEIIRNKQQQQQQNNNNNGAQQQHHDNDTLMMHAHTNPHDCTKGMCSSHVELWLIYIQKVTRDANRRAAVTIFDVNERQNWIRNQVTQAYEVAIQHASFVPNNHVLWKQYLDYVKGWATTTTPITDAPLSTAQAQQMVKLRSIYQRLVTHPMTGLDQLWQEYQSFEKVHSEALAQALIQEYAPKYQHARSVYLDRNKIYKWTDLKMGRLALPPLYRRREEGTTSATASTTTTKTTTTATTTTTTTTTLGDNFVQHTVRTIATSSSSSTTTATSDASGSSAVGGDYNRLAAEEHALLTLWKRRCSYERTNPERLKQDALSQRIRQAYKEMACVFIYHPEVWHMWSTWEADPIRTPLILQFALEHYISNSTFLAYSLAQHYANHQQQQEQTNKSLQIMEQFLETAPNTLGFVLYQQMVRRYRGIKQARSVFARARRTLKHDDLSSSSSAANDNNVSATDGTKDATDEASKLQSRRMVTNRLAPTIGTTNNVQAFDKNGNSSTTTSTTMQPLSSSQDSNNTIAFKSPPGTITWHLYASHAAIEHRWNRLPKVAARVYELGLRKHESFLTKVPYVLRYARLLFELGDTDNLRSLLTRAIAALTANGNNSNNNNNNKLGPLWDMTLHYESILGRRQEEGNSNNNNNEKDASMKLIGDVEKKRHAALMGPEVEDVSTGGSLLAPEPSSSNQASLSKTSISDLLIRSEGYDVSSNIINGMSRMVNVLKVMGLWGSDSGNAFSYYNIMGGTANDNQEDDDDDDYNSGSPSDACFQQRLDYQTRLVLRQLFSNQSHLSSLDNADGSSSNKLSARERLQQNQNQPQQHAGTILSQYNIPTSGNNNNNNNNSSSVMMNHNVIMMLQQSPDWLKPLLTLLTRHSPRAFLKPPPHYTVEMVLSRLKTLPSERPMDDNNNNGGNNNNNNNNNNLSRGKDDDDDNDNDDRRHWSTTSGYGGQFRARQKARQKKPTT